MPTSPTLTWTIAHPIYDGTPLSVNELNAFTGIPGTFNYLPPLGTVLGIGTSTLQVVFYPTDSITYNAVFSSTTITVLPSLLDVIIYPIISYIKVGNPVSFSSTGYYSDGTSKDLTSTTVWSSILGGFAFNKYTCFVTGADTITAVVQGFTATLMVELVNVDFHPLSVPHISHNTQKMLNYFDVNDSRVRKNTASIDAQLLNLGASLLEDLEVRVDREQARNLREVPNNTDNRGVYYGAPLPASVDLDPTDPFLDNVFGIINGIETSLMPFDDLLPQPGGVSLDSTRSSFPLTSPILFSATGPQDIITFNNIGIPVPNTLSFWVSGSETFSDIDVSISGYVFPVSPWMDKREVSTEILTIAGPGVYRTLNRWSTVTSVTFRGIPEGTVISGYSFEFNIPGSADLARPYSDWNSRDELYNRYWSVQNSYLMESYASDYGGGLEYIRSYYSQYPLVDLAVEPNTYGLLLLSGANLLYIDRREPFPSNLSASGLKVSPNYGLNVHYDFTLSTTTRFVVLTPIPSQNASNVTQYRYRIQTPSGISYVLTSNGTLVPLTQLDGWVSGLPVPITIPLVENGTYIFTLECIDSSATLSSDSRPWNAHMLKPLASVDLSPITSAPVGICYDSWNDLWCWDGTTAFPITLNCYSYVLDVANNKIYFTYPVTSVSIQ